MSTTSKARRETQDEEITRAVTEMIAAGDTRRLLKSYHVSVRLEVEPVLAADKETAR